MSATQAESWAAVRAAWQAANEADIAFQEALEAEHGARAGDARYGELQGACAEARVKYRAASAAWHELAVNAQRHA